MIEDRDDCFVLKCSLLLWLDVLMEDEESI
jgi:hypothetical protein